MKNLLNLTRNCCVLICVFLLIIVVSCDKSKDPNSAPEDPNGIITSIKVTDSPTDTLSFETVKNTFSRGDKLKIRLNREKYVVEEFDIVFEATYDEMDEHLIFCKTPDDLFIGSGDSGSPILTPDGKVIGALCYGFYGNNNQFAARAIEDLLEIEPSSPNSSELKSADALGVKLVKPVYFASGIDQNLYSRYFNENDEKYNHPDVHFFDTHSLKSSQIQSEISTGILPGNSISIMEVSGDLFLMGAIGTASIIKDNRMYGFGHSFSGGNDYAIAMPVYQTKMITLIESFEGSYKLALPDKNIIGSLIKDSENGILIDLSASPSVFNINTTIEIGSNDAIQNNHSIAQFTDFGNERFYVRNLIPMLVWYNIEEINEFEYDDTVNAIGNISIEYDNSETYYTDFNLMDWSGSIDYGIYYFIRDNMPLYEDNISNVNFVVSITRNEQFIKDLN